MGINRVKGGESMRYISIKKSRFIPEHIRISNDREKIIDELLDGTD
jgi:hypothetical protein